MTMAKNRDLSAAMAAQLVNGGDLKEREKRVYLQLRELDYNHTKCEIQNTG